MSLNGLDDVKIKEAHDAAIVELGGWFLLKYLSRDEVDLLERGNGGIVEIRNAIAQYPDESPLFGFLRYRRRNVLIKYVPEGCSRLVQARVTVHFNAVTEKFSPYDTLFPIKSSKELKDSTLSAACSLHTASGSTSSSTSSLRKRRLMEIAEDENEDKRQSIEADGRPTTAKESSVAGSQQLSAAREGPRASESYTSTTSDATSLSPPGASNPRPRSPAKSLDGRRQSSASSRPDVYTYNSFGSNGRPKVKLGPRPSLDTGGRPQTSASLGSYRPVSTLPPGMRLLPKNSRNARETTIMGHRDPPPTMTLSPPSASGSDPPVMPITTLVRPHTSGGRPSTSSASSIKAPLSPGLAAPKVPAMTPEKIRLMKALQMRQKKLSAVAPTEPSPSVLNAKPDTSPIPEIRFSEDSTIEKGVISATANEMSRADSGISIEAAPVAKVAASETATMSSTPNSPTAPSEAAVSTQASSVSDSTDETIQEARDGENATNVAEERKSADLSKNHKAQKDGVGEQGNDLLYVGNPDNIKDESDGLKGADFDAKDSEGQEMSATSDKNVLGEPPMHEINVEKGDVSRMERTHDPAPINDESKENIKAGGLKSQHVLNKDITVSSQQSPIPDESIPSKALQEGEPSNRKVKEHVERTRVASPPRELKIPRSKFSSQNLGLRYNAGSVFERETPAAAQEPPSSSPKSPVESTFSNDTKHSITEDDQDVGSTILSKRKRKGIVEPIRTDIEKSGPDSEDEFLSDDDLMDELQSATVQEAKPIQVSKSPNSPAISAPANIIPAEGNRFSRTFSNPFQKDAAKGNFLSIQNRQTDSPRSVSASAAYLSRINQQQSLPVVKKVNLGSGISQRIKALEKLSSSTTTTSPSAGAAGPTAGASSTFFSVTKSSNRTGSVSPSIVERGASLTKGTSSPTSSRESSPETVKFRDRSESIQSRRDAFNSPLTAKPPRSRPESVSVTARIIRDPSLPFPLKPDIGKDASDLSPLDLKESPLVIDHQKAIVAPPSPKKEKKHDRKLSSSSKEARRERRSSISLVKDLINDRRASFAERRKSMTIEPPTPSPNRSSSRPPSTHTNSSNPARPTSVSSRRSSSSHNLSVNVYSQISSTPTSPADEVDKKSGRTSRMLRKMSASLSASRKSFANVISPTVREEFEPPTTLQQSVSSSGLFNLATITTELGDVNIQFPDNLLWKRRFMSLDSHGYLILAQAQGSKSTERSASIKKYHLSEFRMPFVPEMEAQELPNSVVLDFIDGGGLQVACEDRGGQLRVLEVLLEAHRSYGAFGQ